jgi:hypothetical protein
MKILNAMLLSLAPSVAAGHAVADEWTVQVDIYRNFPADEFKALTDLGSMIAKETSNGFLTKTVVTRGGFHEGATFCILFNRNLGDAQTERSRILAAIDGLRADGQYDEFSVTSPSACLE